MRRAANNSRCCDVIGCDRPHWSGGLCSAHYQRKRKNGDPGSALIQTGKGERLAWLKLHAETKQTECLQWPFSFDPSGYGAAEYEGKKIGAHRLMCILTKGKPQSTKLHAAHFCGNKWCVNPNHIRWATASENGLDKRLHGRAVCGEKNNMSKLTESIVQSAKIMKKQGHTFTSIARIYNVSRHTIARAIQGKTWNA